MFIYWPKEEKPLAMSEMFHILKRSSEGFRFHNLKGLWYKPYISEAIFPAGFTGSG